MDMNELVTTAFILGFAFGIEFTLLAVALVSINKIKKPVDPQGQTKYNNLNASRCRLEDLEDIDAAIHV